MQRTGGPSMISDACATFRPPDLLPVALKCIFVEWLPLLSGRTDSKRGMSHSKSSVIDHQFTSSATHACSPASRSKELGRRFPEAPFSSGEERHSRYNAVAVKLYYLPASLSD